MKFVVPQNFSLAIVTIARYRVVIVHDLLICSVFLQCLASYKAKSTYTPRYAYRTNL